jgi:hypothetical protein
VTIHILSDRRFPFSGSPLAAVPLPPRSGFVQSLVVISRCAQSALRGNRATHMPGVGSATRSTSASPSPMRALIGELARAPGETLTIRGPAGAPAPQFSPE